jgi:hypothetical protein
MSEASLVISPPHSFPKLNTFLNLVPTILMNFCLHMCISTRKIDYPSIVQNSTQIISHCTGYNLKSLISQSHVVPTS